MKRVSGQSTPSFGNRNWQPKLNMCNLILVSDLNSLDQIFSDRVLPTTSAMAISTQRNLQFRAHTSMIKNAVPTPIRQSLISRVEAAQETIRGTSIDMGRAKLPPIRTNNRVRVSVKELYIKKKSSEVSPTSTLAPYSPKSSPLKAIFM